MFWDLMAIGVGSIIGSGIMSLTGIGIERTGRSIFIMDFSLLSPLEFFADPKNGDGRNNKPPAMRVRVDCYTKNYLSMYNKVVQAIL